MNTATGNIKHERIYLGGYELYRKYDGHGDLETERQTNKVMDDKRMVALLEVKTVSAGHAVDHTDRVAMVRYQLTDHLDSAALELDGDSYILSYEEYHPFGTTSYSMHTNDAEVSLKRYRYVHKERDEETGLYYYGARYYAPWLCRFISVDPLKDKFPMLTPYQYASNNPITNFDLDGLEGVSVHSNAKSISAFMKTLKIWDAEASKPQYREQLQAANGGPEIYSYSEPKNQAKLRVFAHDITAEKQIINTIGSYNKSFGKFIDAGLPLDLKHFVNYANVAYRNPETLVKSFSIHREYRQAMDSREGGRTSSFTPEDVFSNYLGAYFGSDLSNSDDFVTEFGILLNEAKTLFTTGNLENGKYLTEDRISELKSISSEYYGTDDLTNFKLGSSVYNLDNVRKLNDEAEGRIGPVREGVIKLEYMLDMNDNTNYKRDSTQTSN